MDNFENSIRHKIDDAEHTPPGNMWGRIEAELPQEKKRLGLIWMMWLLPMCLVGGIAVYCINNNDKKVDLTQTLTKPSNSNDAVKQHDNAVSSNLNFNNSNIGNVIQNPPNNLRRSANASLNERAQMLMASEISNTDFNTHDYIDLTNLNSIKKTTLFSSNLKAEAPNRYKIKPYKTPMVIIPEVKNNSQDNKSSMEKPCSWVFESVNNVYKSGRALIANSDATPDQKNYVNVRNSIEYDNWNLSGGIAIKYCFSKHLMVGTGIRITHYSEDLIYNKRDVNVAFEAPPIGIDELVKKKYPYTFTKQTDSIYAGQNYNGGTNYYFFREVPLTFGYYNYGKKYNFFFEPSISYCRIAAIKASLLDLDHVGFTSVNQIDGYAGVSHIFNISVRTGVGLHLSKSVSFNAGLYLSRAITPLIRYNYAKQLPYTYGITLGLEKRL